MPQLLVRNIEETVVRKLRELAAQEGVSVEEEHRRLLRGVLLGEKPGKDFKDFLLAIPTASPGESSELFARRRDLPRKVKL